MIERRERKKISEMINPQFTMTEFPLVEILLDDYSDDQIALFKENCIEQLVPLNIFSIMYKFLNKESIDKYLNYFSQIVIPELNGIIKFNIELLNYINEKYSELVTSFSDIIIEIGSDQLSSINLLNEINNCNYNPIIGITYSCTEEKIAELEQVLDQLDKITKIKTIVLNPDPQVELDLKEYLAFQRKIFASKRKGKVFYDRGNFPAFVLREHPCNAYILSCGNCHAGKKDIPRSFTIVSDGMIYPEGLDQRFSESIMGNIYEDTFPEILKKYWLSENHYFFKEACEKVFHEYVLDYPYGFIPWRYLFFKEASEKLLKE